MYHHIHIFKQDKKIMINEYNYNANLKASEQKILDAMIEDYKSQIKDHIITFQKLKIQGLDNALLMLKFTINAMFNLADRFAYEFDDDEMANDIIQQISKFNKYVKDIERNNSEADNVVNEQNLELGKLSNHYLLLNRFSVN